MAIPPNDSMLWIFARQILLGVGMLVFISLAYNNHMAPQDIVLILGTMASVLGIDIFKRNNAPERGQQ